MAPTTILRDIATAWIGALLALITFAFMIGHGAAAKRALAQLLGGAETYGTFPPGDVARVNSPTDSMYEFPRQTNDARRPARTDNRTEAGAVYPISGAPSMLPAAPMSVTTAPGAPGAAAFDPNGWSDIAPGNAAFDGALLDDLRPSATARPVRSLQDSFAAQFAGHASRVPLDS